MQQCNNQNVGERHLNWLWLFARTAPLDSFQDGDDDDDNNNGNHDNSNDDDDLNRFELFARTVPPDTFQVTFKVFQ